MRRTFVIIALGVIALISCQTENSSDTVIPLSTKTAALSTIIVRTLNITLNGNPNNIYQYTWSKTVDIDQDTKDDLNCALSIARDRYGNFYTIGTTLTAIQAGGGVLSDQTASVFPSNPAVWQARALPSNTVIGSNSGPFNSSAYVSTFTYSYYFGARRGGAIIGKGDKFVGLKFVSNGKVYYGWAKVNVSTNSQTFTIKNIAYQSTSDTGIAAGQVR